MHSIKADYLVVSPLISKQFTRKDTAPPQKSITRGKTVPAPAATKKAPAVASAPKQAKKKPSQIPQGRVSRGIKAPGKVRSDGIQRRLQKTSPWYQSILDPITGADAKIPDDTGVETGTIQLIWKGTITTNPSGFCGMRMLTPYVSSEGNIQMINPAVGPSGISWGWPDPTEPTFNVGSAEKFDGSEDLVAVASHHRIVSAALYVQPECSLADNKGEFVVFTDAFHTMTSSLYDDYVNHFKSAIIPVNANVPGMGRWYPIMIDDDSFKAFLECASSSESYVPPPWNIGFIANGCGPAVSFRVTVAINYEFVPRYNTLNVLDTSPSPQDSQEIDLVENWVQNMDVATVTTTKAVSSAPKTVTPNHGENDGDTGFGMIFNVIKEILPFASLLL